MCLAMLGMGTAIYGFLWYWYGRENRRREGGAVSERHRGMGEEELVELGDDSPQFRYTI